MTAHHDSHRPVVVGVDGTGPAALALDWAANEAALRRAPLLVLRAYSPDYPAARSAGPGQTLPPQPSTVLRDVAEDECKTAVDRARAHHPSLAVSGRTLSGDPGAALVEASSTAGLVVVGARGLGRLRGALMGSVSSHVVPRAHCPAVVVREAPSRSLPDFRVVVGVDASPDSHAALAFAFESAALRGVGLTVVHTWDLDVDGAAAAVAWSVDWKQADEQERSLVAEAVAGFAEDHPDVDVRRHVVHGHPVAELVRQSENAALLVLGSRGRGPVRGMVLGSVSQGVLHAAHCPVAVLTSSSASTLEGVQPAVEHRLHLPVPPVREHL